MKLKLITGYHITATERKSLIYMLENNMTEGCTPLKRYKIEKLEEGKIKVIVQSKYVGTIGDISRWHQSNMILQTSK